MRATPWYNGQRFSILVFYEWLIFIFGIIVLLVRRLAGQHFWSQMRFLILYRWRSFFWDRRCFCYCITRVPPGADRDHWTPKWPQAGRMTKFLWTNHNWKESLGSEWSRYWGFYCAFMCQLLFCSFYVNIIGTFTTWAPPSGAETVSSIRAHEKNDATYVTCCYYIWLTCLSICKYFKCETNVHFYQQRSCLINGLYPWRVYLSGVKHHI